MKTKKGLKRIAALLMCVVLLATSLPLALAANETAYNPAPYFTAEAQKEGAAAWLDVEGDLQVRFPAATGRPTHVEWAKDANTTNVKAIDHYIVEISDLGKKLEKHNPTPPVLLSKTVSATETVSLDADNKISLVFTEEEIGTLLNLEDNRYSISITAVDSEGWYSMSMYASIFDVPEFSFDRNKFEFFEEDPHAMIEMMRFEYVDPNEGYSGYQQTGDTVNLLQRTAYTGAIDPKVSATVASTGFRVRINSDPAASGVTQIIDTPESRQTYDFAGADEVWYWMDLSDVELKGVSFRLRANNKRIDYNLSNASEENSQHYGDIVYSTLGSQYHTYAAGEEPYVLVQNANGNWEKKMIKNGTVDLGHTKGYIRIPIQFFCSETATAVGVRSDVVFGTTKSYNQNNLNSFYNNEVCLGAAGDAYNTGVYSVTAQIDPAGTPISDALLVQNGKMYHNGNIFQTDLSWELGTFLAPGITNEDIVKTTANNPRRATISGSAGNWTVNNRENAYKAIEDIYSAGFSYTGLGEGSVNHSIFFDNVLFYRTDGQAWNAQKLNGVESTGLPGSTYYDQIAYAQNLIFDACDEYIGSPSWTDYRGVRYVKEMIAAYNAAYASVAGQNFADQHFTLPKLTTAATNLGRADSWDKFRQAEIMCRDNNMLDSSNSRPNDIVPMIVQSLEALPDPSTVTTMSDVMRAEIIKLYQAYNCLNYGQLKAFGSYTVQNDDGSATLYEEEKLLAYINLLADQLNDSATITGYKMANYPFILFNKFEDNTEIGDKAWHLEDDPNYSGTADYRHVKNFSTLATGDKKIVDGNDQTIDQLYSDVHTYAHAGETRITADGYNGSKGLTTTINSAAIQGNDNGGVLYATYFNKNNVSTATDFTQYKANNMTSVNLGQLAKNNNSALVESVKNPDGTIYLPFSLVMYVDFSELTAESGAGEFTWGVKIHTTKGGSSVCYRPAMGSNIGGSEYWRSYFILDQDETSTTFGEWKRVFVADRGFGKGIYMFPSKTTNGDGGDSVDMAGYKGYIAIPLNHFKRNDGGIENDFLVTNSEALNNIYSITFAITNASGQSMANKSFTIDNVGFTYDPDYYKNELNTDTSSRNDASYAEVFGAKSSKSVEFETAVAAIDPYDTEEAFKTNYVRALNIYENELKDWQKENVDTVIQAKALLDVYKTYYDGTAAPPPAAMTVDALKAKIAALPAGIPENITTIQPLPRPGFIAAADPRTPGEVNYAGFGFASKEEAQQIAAYYTDTYRRLSVADKASLTDADRTKLLQGYNAAMRCLGTLEMIKTDTTKFSVHLTDIYKPYTVGDQTLRLVKATDRNAIATLSANEYDPLAYYAKAGLSGDDTYAAGSVIPAYKGMTDGLSRYLANVRTNDAGEVTGGGVKVLMDKYTALYNEVKTVLDAEQLLSDDLYARVQEAIAEYNDLLPAYKTVFEVYFGSVEADASGQYQGIKDILDLFPVYDTAFEDGTAVKTVDLTEDKLEEEFPLNVKYIEEVPAASKDAATYFTVSYDGIMHKESDKSQGANLTLYWNGTKVDAAADGTEVRIPDDMNGGGNLQNNTYTPDALRAITLKTVADKTCVENMEGTIVVKQYRPAKNGETADQLVGTYTVYVNVAAAESYFVRIPAEVPVDWGASEADVSYSVNCELDEKTSKISVGVAGASVNAENQGALTNAGTAQSIAYSAVNFTASEFTGVLASKQPDLLPKLEIAAEAWQNIPVARYADTLTYTVTYDKTQTP